MYYGQAKSTFAWEFTNPVRFPQPVPYQPKKGAIVWSRTVADIVIPGLAAADLSPVTARTMQPSAAVGSRRKHPDYHNRVETSLEIVQYLMPIFETFRRILGLRVLTILDPCYCAGEQIKNFAGFPNIKLIHMPEMTLSGSFEVNQWNMPRFLGLHFDLIFTNPPWSADCLNPLLTLLRSLASQKDVPFLYLIPGRCTRTQAYYSTMVGVRLVEWKLPSINFISPTTKTIIRTRDSSQCSVFGFNCPDLPDVDEFVFRPPR